MPFGEIFTGAFARIWRHKKLWLFAMLGLGITALGSLLYGLSATRWVSGYFGLMNRMMRIAQVAPEQLYGNMMSSMGWIWAGAALFGLLALVGYLVNLVARGAIISEAGYAWRNLETQTGRGLRHGLGRAVYVFLIDLIWWLPAVFLVLSGVIAFIVLIAGSAAASQQDSGGGFIAISWLAFVCCGGCLGLLYYLAYVVFSPLMYQSVVAGDRDFGAALREGWALARANFGSMIIFWLLLFLFGIVLNVILQSITFVFSLPLMGGWMNAFGNAMQGFGQGVVPAIPAMSGPLLVVLTLVSAVVSFLITTFTQTLNLTLYAGAYQHLTGIGPAEPPAPAPVEPTPFSQAEPSVPIVEPAPPVVDEVPPTL